MASSEFARKGLPLSAFSANPANPFYPQHRIGIGFIEFFRADSLL
jgi:hypothetical protein